MRLVMIPVLDSAEAGEREAGAVVGVEAFDLDAGFAGGKEEELAVGHNPIDIQQQELYLLCTSLGHGGIVASEGELFL